jgi:flagellar motor component MotA
MLLIAGLAVVIASVCGGYLMSGRHMQLLLQPLTLVAKA